MGTATGTCEVLTQEEWESRRAAHRARLAHWTVPHLARRSRGIKHPVEDFLFDYYPFSVSKLLTWHPGFTVALSGAAAEFAPPTYIPTECGDAVRVDVTRLGRHRARLDLAIRILAGTMSRHAQLGCFGLHEWAMVYRLEPGQVRHEQLDLRISPEDIAATVERVGLRCTHIDAYRFFTEPAMPLNPIEPTRASQPDLEQPGCLHATMDLYKYAMWFQPFVPGELVADAFEVAMRTRELDMRASPYDLADDIAYPPVPVETVDGRREYAREQAALMAAAEPLRERLLRSLTDLRCAMDSPLP